jgi:hypothetical protein
MNDFSCLLDNKINSSNKKEIIKKKKIIINTEENQIYKETECYQLKKIQFDNMLHNRHKKNRSKPLDCDLITNMEEFMSNQPVENVSYNKLDKYMKKRLIEEYIKDYEKENNISYEEAKKIVNIALFNKKKIIYDIETKKITKIG